MGTIKTFEGFRDEMKNFKDALDEHLPETDDMSMDEDDVRSDNNITVQKIKNKIELDTDLKLFDEVTEDIKKLKIKFGKTTEPYYIDLVKLWHTHYHPVIMKRYEDGTAPK